MTHTARRLVVVLLLFVGLLLGRQFPDAASSTLVISAVLFDPYLSGEPEEAVEVTNISAVPRDLAGWQLTDNEDTVTFPSLQLAPGARIWATKTATSFAEEFGFSPAFEYGGDSDPAVPDLTGTAPALANAGDEIVLLDANGQVVDAVVYRDGDTNQSGWSGPGVQPYNNGFFGQEGQILYRKLDQATGLPVPDTDVAGDWAQATDDDVNGKKVRYPGWSLDTFFQTTTTTESGDVRLFVAPDHLFEEVRAVIDSATQSLDIEGYTLTNADLVDAIVARQGLGVAVRVLLEGEPVGGVSDQERWAAQQIEQAGGQVYFMHTDGDADIHDRYTFQHAKFLIVDDGTVLIGSENLGSTGMPADDKSDGTAGNRGTYALLTAPTIVDRFRAIFADDVDPATHKDLFRWSAPDETYGAPPDEFVPSRDSGGSSYQILKQNPFQTTAFVPIEVIQCPENCLRDADALLGLIARVGPGDTLLIEQLYERRFWGTTTSAPPFI